MNEAYLNQMYNQLTGGHTYNEARLTFEQLEINAPSTGDLYFQTFGIPNIIERSDNAFERFACYELLLLHLKNDDYKKFELIHKGTPYYFLAWLSFDISNIQKAVYFLNLALGEDQRNFQKDWLKTPGTKALLLDIEKSGPVARVVATLRNVVEVQLAEFNTSTSSKISSEITFLNLLMDLCDPKNSLKTNSIFTSILTFLYEYDEINKMTHLGNTNSSLEPIISNLFKGGLVFESLLKHIYRAQLAKEKSYITLRKVLGLKELKSDFNIKNNIDISANSVKELLTDADKETVEFTFSTTGKIRNFSGHDLARENEMGKLENFRILHKQIRSGLFYILRQHYSKPNNVK